MCCSVLQCVAVCCSVLHCVDPYQDGEWAQKSTLRKSDRVSEVELIHDDLYWPESFKGFNHTLGGPQLK